MFVYVGNSGLARLVRRIVLDVSTNFSPADGVPLTENWEAIVKDAKIQLDILSQSKRSFLRLLDPTTHSLDLSGMDLSGIRFPRLNDTAVNFRGACLIGTDLTELTLDRGSLLSILEADVGHYTTVYSFASARDDGFLNSLFTTVHLSTEQRDALSTPSKKLD